MAASRGLLLSFDGVDCSGKETQSKQLTARLQTEGLIVHRFQTPDYELESGQRLKTMLQDAADWQTRPWPEKLKYFADNRAEHRAEVLAALAAGEIVIYDRYVPSSLTFIAVEAGPAERLAAQAAVARYEYETNHMPQEDVSIFLDVPPGIADQLLHGRKVKHQEADEYTDQLTLQEKLYQEYDQLIAAQPERFLRVACLTYGQLRHIDDIAATIWQSLQDKFTQLKKYG
jgi:dTMP kinase